MNNYSYLDRKLHHVLLGESSFAKYLHSRLYLKAKIFPDKSIKKIFITGLARSGTTALLNKIYSNNQVGSLLYKYMPFVLSPRIAKIWGDLHKSDVSDNLIERIHGDGLKISLESPECLDEVFWRFSFPDIYTRKIFKFPKISNYHLDAYSYFLQKYGSIQNKKMLVIKNNNNHCRLESLVKYFKNDYFIVSFRDPIQHSLSLLNQHKLFVNIHKDQPFVLEYMNMLGHREFGLNFLPFCYINKKKENNWIEQNDPQKIDYWLNQWKSTYSYLLNSNIFKKDNVIPICYEKLCSEDFYFNKLCGFLKLKPYSTSFEFKEGNPSKYKDFKLNANVEKLYSITKKIYSDLEKLSFEKLNK